MFSHKVVHIVAHIVISCHSTDWSSISSRPAIILDFQLSSFDQTGTSVNRDAFDFRTACSCSCAAFCSAWNCTMFRVYIFQFFLHHYLMDFWLLHLQHHAELSFLSCLCDVISRFNILIVFHYPYFFSFLTSSLFFSISLTERWYLFVLCLYYMIFWLLSAHIYYCQILIYSHQTPATDLEHCHYFWQIVILVCLSTTQQSSF
jgi:hypothetical protein